MIFDASQHPRLAPDTRIVAYHSARAVDLRNIVHPRISEMTEIRLTFDIAADVSAANVGEIAHCPNTEQAPLSDDDRVVRQHFIFLLHLGGLRTRSRER